MTKKSSTYKMKRILLIMLAAMLTLGCAAPAYAEETGQQTTDPQLSPTPQPVAPGPQLDASGAHLQYLRADGAVDTAFNGFLKHDGIWYYLQAGTSAHDILGLVKNEDNGRWFFVREGKVDWKFTGLAKSTYNNKWYFVRKGELDAKFTGVAKSVANGKWYFCRKGRLDRKFTGLAKSAKNGKWYYVKKGKLDRNYTGLAKSVKNGKWYYVSKGKLDWKYSGKVKYKGKKYKVRNGKVTGRVKKKAKKTTSKTSTEKGTSGKGRTVYLTFDDGPGPHTDRLLKILAKYDVKATFFVTGHFAGNRDCIKRAATAGHAIGAHTMTHDYKKIYSSDKAFWNDQDEIQKIIKKQTGSRTKLMRFPGGSSNTVSRKYSSGIMSRLAKQSAQKGLVYFDWNVLSGDAGETKSSKVVAQNIINGIQKHKESVVLCHDTKSYTVDAMDQVLSWATKNGYTFRVLTTSSPTAHQGIAN